MLFPVRLRQSVYLLGLALSLCVLPVFAEVEPAALARAIEKAHILGKDYPVQAAVFGAQAEVSTYRNPRATDKDCKIDAVLVAREVMKAAPGQIMRVKTLFYDQTDVARCRQVVVSQADVKAYAARALSPDQLLASIAIERRTMPLAWRRFRGRSYREILRSQEVVDGPLKAERLEMLGRIEVLKERGDRVARLMGQFLRVEDKVRSGNPDAVINSFSVLVQNVKAEEEKFKLN